MAIMAVWCALVILVCAAHGHAEGAWVLWERGNTRVFDKNHQEGEKPTKTLKAKAAAPDFLRGLQAMESMVTAQKARHEALREIVGGKGHCSGKQGAGETGIQTMTPFPGTAGV
jgi:hypothetical protein